MVTCYVDYDDGPDMARSSSRRMARTRSMRVGRQRRNGLVKLPSQGVRPWIFLYHEGDSVTIESRYVLSVAARCMHEISKSCTKVA